MRRILLWLTLAMILALIVLSIVGAFKKTERAAVMFNATPLAAYWIGLALLTAAGLIFFKRLLRSPGLLAIHAGCICVLAGSLLGSKRGHDVTNRLFDRDKIHTGGMVIYEGLSSDRVVGKKAGEVAGTLPFKIRLEDFWMEYYQPAPLYLIRYVEEDGEYIRDESVEIPWQDGEAFAVPDTDITVRVVEYVPAAQPKFPPDVTGMLVYHSREGLKPLLPGRVGEQTDLGEPGAGMRVRIAAVYRNHIVSDEGGRRRYIDLPGLPDNPGVEVEVMMPDGRGKRMLVMASRHGNAPLAYLFDPPRDFPPHDRGRARVMEIELTRQGEPIQFPLVDDPVWGRRRQTLGPWLWTPHARPVLGKVTHELVMDCPMVRDYKSELTVIDRGAKAARKTIEVNDPLHYGGYHFYQHNWDKDREGYTVLGVHSDSGLTTTYVGFGLVCGGTFWLFWVQPPLTLWRRRRANG